MSDPSTPNRSVVDPPDAEGNGHDDDENNNCWIPTPDASRAGTEAANAHQDAANATVDSPVMKDDQSNDLTSEVTMGGSIRRRLAEADNDNAHNANGYRATSPNDSTAAMTNSAHNNNNNNPLVSLLLFLTKTSLNTTTHLLAPPLHVTRTVLLPALYYGLRDLYEATTPTRVKDWASIFTKSVSHLWEVIISSRKGQQFRGQVGQVGGDLVDVAATPSARQVLVEGTATIIKVGEALHTPEVRSLLSQLGTLTCRLFDAAATGAAKQLVGDVAECVWTAVELLVSRDTTLGLAECCAYLCHALEMEHGVWRETGGRGRRQDGGGNDEDRAEAARRRRERARRNARLYGSEGETIDGDAHLDSDAGGIEEALLASLGDAYRIYGRNDETRGGGDAGDDAGSRHDVDVDGSMSLPSRVVVQSPPTVGGDELGDGLEPPSTGGGIKDDACSSIGSGGDHDHTQDQTYGDADAPRNSSFANEACDVEFLRRRIAQRARTMEAEQKRNRGRQQQQRQQQRQGEGSAVVDIEEASSVSEFYRLVEQISSERQAEAVSSILDEEERTSTSNAPLKRKFYPRAAAAAGAGNEHGQDTLKSRLEAYVSRRSRERAGIGVGGGDSRPTPRKPRGFLGNRMVVWVLLLWFLLGCAVIGGFSCYGIYIFVFAPATPPTMASVPLLKGLAGAAPKLPTATIPHQSSPAPTEIVVRIVREVVHMTPDGNAYAGAGPDAADMGEADTLALEEKIAEAAVGALQNAATKTGFEKEKSRPTEDISSEL